MKEEVGFSLPQLVSNGTGVVQKRQRRKRYLFTATDGCFIFDEVVGEVGPITLIPWDSGSVEVSSLRYD